MTTVAIIGATGNVGRPLTHFLLERGVRVRALGRSPERLADLVARGAEARVGTVTDARFVAEAFRGVDAVWAMIPPNYGDPDPRAHQTRVVDALGAGIQVARVRHIATLSSIGADQPAGNGPIAGLHDLEQRLNQVPGLHLLHARAGYFFENFLRSIGLIRQAGITGGLFRGDLPISMVATVDIARRAAEALAGPSFTGQSVLELRGPRDYTMREAAALLGAAIGRPDLAYVEFAAPDVRSALVAGGFSETMADLFVEMAQGFNTGHCRPLAPRSPASTTPTSLEHWAGGVFAPAFAGA